MKKALLALLCLLPLLCAARAEAAYKIGVDIENQIVTVYRADDDGEDSIVRQMIECIKVHGDGRLTIIFGGGYEIEETL